MEAWFPIVLEKLIDCRGRLINLLPITCTTL